MGERGKQHTVGTTPNTDTSLFNSSISRSLWKTGKNGGSHRFTGR